MKVKPSLVTTPSADTDFAAAAQAALNGLPAGLDEARAQSELERRLQQHYPGAVVREREQIAGFGRPDEVVWYVTRRRYGSRLARKIEIAAPPELVFSVYVDRFADWIVGVKVERTRLQPGIVGTEYKASYELFGRTLEGRFRVVEADPPRSVRVEARGLGGVQVWYVTTFSTTTHGTLVEVMGDYDLPRRALPGAGMAFEQVINHEIDRGHRSLRTLCERAARAMSAAKAQ